MKRWLEASPVDTDPPRDELIMKVLLAIGRGSTEAIALIDEQRGALLVGLQMGRRRLRTEDDGDGRREDGQELAEQRTRTPGGVAEIGRGGVGRDRGHGWGGS